MKDTALVWTWCAICLALLTFTAIDGRLRSELDSLNARLAQIAEVR